MGGLRMAKATKKDMEAALLLCGMLEDVESGPFPRCTHLHKTDDDPEEFDENDPDHLRQFYDRVMTCVKHPPSGVSRVIWGFQTIMDNNILDPNVTHLELHPRFNHDKLLKAAKAAVSRISHLRDVKSSTAEREAALPALFKSAEQLAEAVLEKETPA